MKSWFVMIDGAGKMIACESRMRAMWMASDINGWLKDRGAGDMYSARPELREQTAEAIRGYAITLDLDDHDTLTITVATGPEQLDEGRSDRQSGKHS